MDDLMGKIERGEAKYNFDPSLLHLNTFLCTVRNSILLEHIIEELYPKENERKEAIEKLDAKYNKKALDIITQILKKDE